MPERNLKFELSIEGLQPDDFHVARFSGGEVLSETYRLRVEAACSKALGPDELLGKKASLRLLLADEVARAFHGLVVECAVDSIEESSASVALEIAPRVELLKAGRGARILQEINVPDAVKTVLKAHGLDGGSAQDWQVRGSYPKRETIAQFDESDFHFIARLLAEEGIGFAVHQGEDEEQLVFFDDSTAAEPIPGESTLHDRSTTQLQEDTAFEVRERSAGACDAASLRDYDFQRPGVDLTSIESAESSTGRELYFHPAGYTQEGEVKRLTQRTLERLRVPTRQLQGDSDCPRLEPGRVFRLESHPRVSLNEEYLLVSISHRGELHSDSGEEAGPSEGGGSYLAHFTAIPKKVPYRPPHLPGRLAACAQVGFVTCPSGEEIHADPFGRVKVRFPWDRSGKKDDKSSCWLRVGQVPMGGSMILPRGDFEVVVDHELGDLDRPFVSGHLYNSELPPPYALPGGKTRSSIQSATTSGGAGANELRFEDSAGSEEIFLNASKDLTVSVENDASTSIVNNEKIQIGSNHSQRVGAKRVHEVGAAHQLSVSADQKVSVEQNFSETVGGSASIDIGAIRKLKIGGDHAEECGGSLTRSVAALQCVTALRGYQRNITGASTIQVGAAWTEVVGRNRIAAIQGRNTETIAGLKMTKAKQVTSSCGAAYASTSGADSVKCGGGRSDQAKGPLALTAGGGMSVKAKEITFEAKNSLTLVAGACTFKLSKDGKIEVKAPTVNLKGVKTLTQLQHKSN